MLKEKPIESLTEGYDKLMIVKNHINDLEKRTYLNMGKDMKKMRIKSGKSLRWTAKKIGCSATYLCDVELGRRNPTRNLCEWYDRLF